ncbi:MAG: superoxide dismutase, Ni [Candidatus Cloacimonadota bacterium]|nr:MAG: superoxide dismutase, Ni [Candidatus Cloacimonadota bacterium]PIE80640.1 MAG: superoxide dismutase, Ni [Candidatus Delongbacteria bacterium]
MKDKKIIVANAHCDGPCGVYDPSSARIAAEAVVSMTKKLIGLKTPDINNIEAFRSYLNSFSRYVAIKEEQAHIAKTELLVLWTDYFKPVHLEKYPNLHDLFWKAAKLCSATKVEINLEKCEELMKTIEEIHNIFWETKGRDINFFTAS